jgi:hypothetical protein
MGGREVGVGVTVGIGVTVAVKLGEGERVGLLCGEIIPQADSNTPRQASNMA